MENLPIDINYNKLLDWLINRRHCTQQWQPIAAVIRQKIIKAVENMPDSEDAAQLTDPAAVTYFQVKALMEKIKGTDSGKRNIFGQYASQIMKDWAEIVKLYEKDCVYLAETAQMIAHNVNYEIPAIKKQITRCQQIQKECERKETELSSGAADLRKKYAASCRQIGIVGEKIKTELAALVQDLPRDFEQIAAAAKDLKDAVEYYDDFVRFIMNNQLQQSSLPMLQFIQSHGNVTTYEWHTGKKPEVVEEQTIRIDLSDEQDETTQSEEIDWGATEANDAIDFGDEIDFGIADITVESGGLETEKDAVRENSTNTDGLSLAVGKEEGVARGNDALSVLDNPQTRNLFIDDLMELESFVTQRLTELTGRDSGMSGSQFQSAPSSIQLDASHVEMMAEKIESIIGQLTSVQMQHLMLIRSSPRYVDRLRDSLRQILIQSDKFVLASKDMASKRRLTLHEESLLEPRLDAIRALTHTMQKQLEEDISQKYKGRKVNIMGEINMI